MATAQTLSAVPAGKSYFPVILKAGLIAGALDITAACLQYTIKTGNNPVKVLWFVASGVFGRRAITEGGPLYAVAGLLFHFVIALIFAAIFYYAWPVLRLVTKNRLVMGVLYGILVWLAMNRVVVPLSNTPQGPFNWASAIQAMLILVVCIGIPIAWIVGKYRGLRG
jgi:hypothetical protein